MTRITIITDVDSIVLSDCYTVPWKVWAIKKDGITGLFGTPATREEAADIPSHDGAYWPHHLTQKPRSISLDCFIRGFSSVEAARARDRINALSGKRLELLVEDAAGRRHLYGWLASDPEPMMACTERGFGFGLVITCPDPLKYGDPVTFAPSGDVDADGFRTIAVENVGTAASWPRLEVSRPASLVEVRSGGRRVRWSSVSPVQLELDFRDGIPSAGVVGADDMFALPPGVSVVRVRASRHDGDGALVDVSDAVGLVLAPAWR